MQVSPAQVYAQVLAIGGTTVQAQVAAALVDGVESDGDPTELSGGKGPAAGLFQYEPGTWLGQGGGQYAPVAQDASWQDQVAVFVHGTASNNFGVGGPDLVANSGDPNSASNPSYGYTGGPQTGSLGSGEARSVRSLGPSISQGGGGGAQVANVATAATGSSGGTGDELENILFLGNVNATSQQADALDTIRGDLTTIGFTPAQVSSLTNWAWGEITKNVDPTQIGLDLLTRPEFQQQFPFFTQVNQSLTSQGQQALSPSTYMQLTQQYIQAAQAGAAPRPGC